MVQTTQGSLCNTWIQFIHDSHYVRWFLTQVIDVRFSDGPISKESLQLFDLTDILHIYRNIKFPNIFWDNKSYCFQYLEMIDSRASLWKFILNLSQAFHTFSSWLLTNMLISSAKIISGMFRTEMNCVCNCLWMPVTCISGYHTVPWTHGYTRLRIAQAVLPGYHPIVIVQGRPFY